MQQSLDRASKAGANFDFEHRLLMRDGRVKHLHVLARALKTSSDNLEYVGAVTDVTAAKQAEGKIRQSERELRQLIDVIPQQVFVFDSDWSPLFANQRELEYPGLALQDVQSKDAVARFFHPEDLKKLEVIRERMGLDPFEIEARIQGKHGQHRWFLIQDNPPRDEQGRVLRWYDTRTDIEDRKRAEMLLSGQKRLLEMIARGDSLALILDALCRLLEELASGSLSSILLLDPNANCLRHGAAPSLPIPYTEAIDGAVIGPSVGSCGTAAYRAEPVIVSDIATDPLWADYRELALAHGLRAYWSTPILSSTGRVLGTFATYYREPRSPTPQEHNFIEQITHLASIAVERKQAEEKIRQSERELRQLLNLSPQHISEFGPRGSRLYTNKAALDYYGLTLEEWQSADLNRVLHPQDAERLTSETPSKFLGGSPWEIEMRLRRRDGQYRWFLFRLNPMLDEQGRITRWYAAATDIEDRRQAEQRLRNENVALRGEIAIRHRCSRRSSELRRPCKRCFPGYLRSLRPTPTF